MLIEGRGNRSDLSIPFDHFGIHYVSLLLRFLHSILQSVFQQQMDSVLIMSVEWLRAEKTHQMKISLAHFAMPLQTTLALELLVACIAVEPDLAV